MPVQVPPDAVEGQEPAPFAGAESAEQGAPLHTGRADQVPAVHVSVVEPEAMPLGHEMTQVDPLAVMGQLPSPYCVGGLLIAGQVGLLQTGNADHTPLVHVTVREPDCRP